jgi:hypothetical protein
MYCTGLTDRHRKMYNGMCFGRFDAHYAPVTEAGVVSGRMARRGCRSGEKVDDVVVAEEGMTTLRWVCESAEDLYDIKPMYVSRGL